MGRDKSQRYSKIRSTLFIMVFLSVFFISCSLNAPLPAYDHQRNCYAVDVAVGPEDFVFDKWHSSPRLLISSLDRRNPDKLGDIYFFDLKTGYSSPMPRTGEPETLLSFRPKGMDTRRTHNKTFLYVIIHNPHDNSEKDESAIAVYQVLEKELRFVRLMEDTEHLWSPNDLSVLKNGEVYITNDYHNELEVILGKKSSEIVHFSLKENRWSVVASDLSLANGILARTDRVFVAATRSNKLVEYRRHNDGTLDKGKTLVEVKGVDNIMPFGRKLLVAAHFNDVAYVRHVKKNEVPSPSVIFLIDPDTGIQEEIIRTVYVNDGNQISAASTAFIYKGKLYISQVFGSKIVVCDAVDLDPSPSQ